MKAVNLYWWSSIWFLWCDMWYFTELYLSLLSTTYICLMILLPVICFLNPDCMHMIRLFILLPLTLLIPEVQNTLNQIIPIKIWNKINNQAKFWLTDLFWHCCVIVLVDCTLFSRNNIIMQKPELSKGIFWWSFV